MKRIFYFVALVVFLLTACGNEENSDETDTYKISEGKIMNEKLLINLAVRAETIIEKYDRLDGVEVDDANIRADKHPDLENDETEEIYKNVYYIDGEYSYQGRNYDFVWCASFNENNTDSEGQVLQYTSEQTGQQININRSPIK
ncbi:hypothetical protein [Bacillus sp. FJAT-22090]|uniref:hypothetical protein n=1 Tax=Bacillus sp. FJAT-22090 TaxID=1581038 RepID=UPI0011A11426|nr:hypothetical protein [Bacillus sp. FJAT-22090]